MGCSKEYSNVGNYPFICSKEPYQTDDKKDVDGDGKKDKVMVARISYKSFYVDCQAYSKVDPSKISSTAKKALDQVCAGSNQSNSQVLYDISDDPDVAVFDNLGNSIWSSDYFKRELGDIVLGNGKIFDFSTTSLKVKDDRVFDPAKSKNLWCHLSPSDDEIPDWTEVTFIRWILTRNPKGEITIGADVKVGSTIISNVPASDLSLSQPIP